MVDDALITALEISVPAIATAIGIAYAGHRIEKGEELNLIKNAKKSGNPLKYLLKELPKVDGDEWAYYNRMRKVAEKLLSGKSREKFFKKYWTQYYGGSTEWY